MATSRMSRDDEVQNELTRPVAVADIGNAGRDVAMVASDAELQRIAERLGQPSVRHLSAAVAVRRRRDGLIAATGTGEAEVEHHCVVTLERFVRPYHFDIAGLYDPSPQPAPADMEIDVDPLAEDPPEAAIDGRIDLGELVLQELAVSLDPFPRAPGSAFDAASDPALADGGPFAALRRLRGGRS